MRGELVTIVALLPPLRERVLRELARCTEVLMLILGVRDLLPTIPDVVVLPASFSARLLPLSVRAAHDLEHLLLRGQVSDQGSLCVHALVVHCGYGLGGRGLGRAPSLVGRGGVRTASLLAPDNRLASLNSSLNIAVSAELAAVLDAVGGGETAA